MTRKEIKVLEQLYKEINCPNQTIHEISKHTNLEMDTVTDVINILIKKGYVGKRADNINSEAWKIESSGIKKMRGVVFNKISNFFNREWIRKVFWYVIASTIGLLVLKILNLLPSITTVLSKLVVHI